MQDDADVNLTQILVSNLDKILQNPEDRGCMLL